MVNRYAIAEIRRYTTAVLMARAEYAAHPSTTDCPTNLCTSRTLCARCRRDLEADLRIATSEAECAEILALLDLPSPRPVAQCGTESGYTQHRRRGEVPCAPCRSASTAATNARHRRRRNKETP